MAWLVVVADMRTSDAIEAYGPFDKENDAHDYVTRVGHNAERHVSVVPLTDV
jgi:hypothetical protein